MTTMTLDRPTARPTARPTVRQPQQARPDQERQPQARPTQVRLTHRGRLVVLVAALVVAFAIGVFVTAAGSVATQEPGTAEPTRIIQVGSGDTLWDIASGLAEDGQVRPMMKHIEELNALESPVLQAGQRLVVPAS